MNKSTLQRALEIVRPGLSNKEGVIEQATSFAFIGGNVVTYNDEISISHPVEGLEIEGAIKADAFYGLISKIKKEELEIEITESEVIITSGRTKAGIALQAEVTLPLEEITGKRKWKALPANFLNLLQFAAGACTSNLSLPVLTCLNITGTTIEASDSYKVINAILSEDMGMKSFLLPASAVSAIVKLSPTKISEGSGWVHFKTAEGTTISCRIFDDEFPELSHLLKVKGTKTMLPATLSDIIERANVFAHRDIALDESIEINLTEKKLTVSSNSEYGWFEESTKMTYTGDECTFIISPYLLKGILDQTLECTIGKDRLKFIGKDWQYITALK